MILDVAKALKSPGVDFPFSLSGEWPAQEFSGDVLTFPAPVTLSGTYMGIGESVTVRAELDAQVCAPCARCTDPATAKVHAQLDEVFTREMDESQGRRAAAPKRAARERDDAEELPESSEGEGGTIRGTVIDLTEAAMAALFTQLPMRFLCKKSCKGLCPQCGANLNEARCSCQEGASDNPFAALTSMEFPEEEV